MWVKSSAARSVASTEAMKFGSGRNLLGRALRGPLSRCDADCAAAYGLKPCFLQKILRKRGFRDIGWVHYNLEDCEIVRKGANRRVVEALNGLLNLRNEYLACLGQRVDRALTRVARRRRHLMRQDFASADQKVSRHVHPPYFGISGWYPGSPQLTR